MTFGPHGLNAVSWWGAAAPPTGPVGTAATWVGGNFGFNSAGRIAGFRKYNDVGDSGDGYVVLYDPVANLVIRSVTFRPRAVTTSAAWHQVWIRPWFRVSLSQSYGLYFLFPGAHYYRFNSHLGGGLTQNTITFIQGFQSTALFPFGSVTTNGNANGVDLLLQLD